MPHLAANPMRVGWLVPETQAIASKNEENLSLNWLYLKINICKLQFTSHHITSWHINSSSISSYIYFDSNHMCTDVVLYVTFPVVHTSVFVVVI